MNSSIQYIWYDQATQVNGLCFFPSFSVHSNYDNYFMAISQPVDVPYEDNIPGVDVVYER